MILQQQGDVLLFQTTDDGEISVVNGVTTMTPGLENAVYLSMFGGNVFDTGSDGNINEYWGNRLVNEISKKYRSETQNLLAGLPAVTGNLKRIKEAAERDLSWMIPSGLVSSFEVSVTMPNLNKIKIVVNIDGNQSDDLTYELNWLASIEQ